MNILKCAFCFALAAIIVLIISQSVMNQFIHLVAASGTIVKVEPYENYAPVNETFVVNATVVDVLNLYGVEIALYWNASILQAVSVDVRIGESDGVLYAPIFIAMNNLTDGKYLISATSTSGTPFSGSGNVVRITFKVIVIAESPLDLESQLYDYPPPDREPRISWPIEHTSVDGIVVPEFPSVAILILIFFATTTFGVLYVKRGVLLKQNLLAKQKAIR